MISREGKKQDQSSRIRGILSAVEDSVIDKIKVVKSKLYNSGHIMEEFTKSIFLTLANRSVAKECELNLQTQLVMCHKRFGEHVSFNR